MIKLLLTCSTVLFSSLPLFAQSVDTAWVRRYNGPGYGNDRANAIAVDDSGNVHVTGSSFAVGASDDYATVKYDANGDTAWVRRYVGPGNNSDQAQAIGLDDSGNVYVTGWSDGSATWGYVTIRYYPSGDTAWLRTYGGAVSWDNYDCSMAVDSSGNVYLTIEGPEAGIYSDFVTIRYYPNGDTAWVRRYDGPANEGDAGRDIAVDGTGNCYVTGYSYGSGTSSDFATIKYYPNGDTAWLRRYDGPDSQSDVGYAMAVDGEANVYVTGHSYSGGINVDFATIKYYPNGDTAWVRRYDGPANWLDYPRDIAVDDSGYVYVTGYSAQSVSYPYNYDYLTIKYHSNGDTAWLRRYNGPDNDEDQAMALAVGSSGDVYVTGRSRSSGTGYDYLTMCYHPDGELAWLERYDGGGNVDDWAHAIAVDDSDNVYVTGRSMGSGTPEDYATIKYVQTGSEVRDETGTREMPTHFTLLQNYPNPFNPITKIQFALAKSGFVSLGIYDLLGKRVRTLVAEDLSAGYKSVIWDARDEGGKEVASGIYFYQLRAGSLTETKKMLLLK